MKIRELRRLIAGFGCTLIQNHKGHCEENAHLERSHRTDDDEFYIPRVFNVKSERDLLYESHGYIYYYNNLREHSSLDYKTPFEYLKQQMPELNDNIKYAQPILLDAVSSAIGDWSGYNVLAQNQKEINMNLSVGIIGLPNVGKSTLFNALLKKQAALAANYPFATIEPNVGVVPVP